jgi:hypothetical protein
MEGVDCFTHKADREASLPERGNGPVAWSDLQAERLQQTPKKQANGEPSTKHALNLFAYVPRSSKLTSRSTVVDTAE